MYALIEKIVWPTKNKNKLVFCVIFSAIDFDKLNIHKILMYYKAGESICEKKSEKF